MAILRIEPNIVDSGGDFTFNNVVATSGITAGNILSQGYYWANGSAFISSNYGDSNVAAYLGSYFTYANANAASQSTAISSLQSNVAFQANLIDVLSGNAATQGSILDTLVANAAVQSANLTSLLSNAAAQESSLTSLVSNAAAQSGAIDSINANIGAYQTYANANAASQQTSINTINANIGAYQTWANTTTYSNSNVSSYLAATYPIVNDGALRLGTGSGPDIYVDALNDIFLGHGGTNYTTVHVDGRPTFSSNATFTANATVSGGANLTINSASNITVKTGAGLHLQSGANIYGDSAYLNSITISGNAATGNVSAAGYYFANGAPFTSSNYGNSNVAAYLSGNVTTGNISSTGYYFANGAPFASSNYGNIDVATYLPTYTGNLNPGNVTATGNIVGGGVRTTTGPTKPSSPTPGDMWYDTTIDTLFRYSDLGGTRNWIDITGLATEITLSNNVNAQITNYLAGNIIVGNIRSGGYYLADGSPFITGMGSVSTVANVTMSTNHRYICNTAVVAITLSLPASATLGDEVGIIDGTGNCSVNNITVARNGHKIQGLAEDLTVSTNRAAFTLVYYNVDQGWLLTQV